MSLNLHELRKGLFGVFPLMQFIAHYFEKQATVVKPDYIVLIILYLFSLSKNEHVINFPHSGGGLKHLPKPTIFVTIVVVVVLVCMVQLY